MAMTEDSMAYLKNNDGNVRSYYLRSTVDQTIVLLIRYSHSDTQYLYYKHVYPSHGQG
jgi:hypothetical protein